MLFLGLCAGRFIIHRVITVVLFSFCKIDLLIDLKKKNKIKSMSYVLHCGSVEVVCSVSRTLGSFKPNIVTSNTVVTLLCSPPNEPV